MTPRTAIARLRRVSCAQMAQLPVTAKAMALPHPSLAPNNALGTHKTSAMFSFIPATSQASECLEQGQNMVQGTDTRLASESVCACHISLPWKVLPTSQAKRKPKKSAHPSCLLVTFVRNTVK